MSRTPARNGQGGRIPDAPDVQESLRLWPHSVEAENGVLGSVLLDPEVLNDVAGLLKPEDFFGAARGECWQVILDLYQTARAIDPITVGDELKRAGKFDDIGGDFGLSQILGAVPHSANAKHYAEVVREKSVARQLAHATRSIQGDIASQTHTADDLLERAETAVFAIAESRTQESTHQAKVAVSGALARLERRRRGPSGISCGLDALDRMTDGFQPGQLVILAARPSMGKTQLGLNVFEYCTLVRREPALFVSLEMSSNEIGERLAVCRSGVPNYKFKDFDSITTDEWGRLLKADTDWANAPAMIDDSPALSTLQITALTRRWKARAGLKLLIVDYLQLVTPSEGESRQEEVASISRGLKRIARELGIAVVCLSQLNRSNEQRQDKKPRMSDLRESGAIEQDADVVLLMHRPDYYDPSDKPGYCELIVAKNRNGAVGSVDLRFFKDQGRFEPWVSDVDPSRPEIDPSQF
jgi:replicative DNA helicase